MLSIFFLNKTICIYVYFFHDYIFEVKMNSVSQNEFMYHDLHAILNIKIHKKFLRVINNEIPAMIKRLMKRRFIFNKCSKYCLSIS